MDEPVDKTIKQCIDNRVQGGMRRKYSHVVMGGGGAKINGLVLVRWL